jgi:hypothetical protein
MTIAFDACRLSGSPRESSAPPPPLGVSSSRSKSRSDPRSRNALAPRVGGPGSSNGNRFVVTTGASGSSSARKSPSTARPRRAPKRATASRIAIATAASRPPPSPK